MASIFSNNLRFIAFFAGFLALCITTLSTVPTSAQELPKNEQELQDFVRDYILENPEILIEAINLYERRQQEEAIARQQEFLSAPNSILTQSENQVVVGNPDGDVTLVEFFDYNCGFCRRALSEVDRLLEEDKNLKLVLKEFPVLGPGSVAAARVSIAAAKIDTGKYLELHRRLLSTHGQLDLRTALAISEQVGYDKGAIEGRLEEDDIQDTIEEVYSIARTLGLTGTPTFILADEILPGAVDYETLRDKVESVRACGRTACS